MNHEKEIRFAEMFSGIGGFRLGLESSGWQCVWANDNDKYANKIYHKNFGDNELVEGDIRKINAKTVPDCDLLTAGFPCQAFSVAGKRKATEDSRGTLFTHIARVAARKKPKLLFLENVKGLLSSESGRTFAIILRTLGNLGYLLEWQVLNSKHYGVPQNRERVFLVGHLTKGSSRQIFPIGKTCENPNGTQKETQRERTWIRSSYPSVDTRTGSTARGQHFVAGSLGVGGSFKERNLIARTLKSRYYNKDGSENLIQRVPLKFMSRNQKNIEGDYAFCVDGANTGGILEKRRIRRLTPIECERLQGFPDGWTEGVSDTQRYKLLGNAVTVNVIKFLGTKILQK